MRSYRYIPIFAALAGICGAVLRGANLRTGYELGTRLPIAGNLPQTLLIILSILVFAALLLWTQPLKSRTGTLFLDAFGCKDCTPYKALAALTAFVMGIAGIAGIYTLVTQPTEGLAASLPMIPLWILAVLSMFSFIITASTQTHGVTTENRAIFAIIPMFWACFDLIITFRDNSASPFVSLYAFELLAAIFLMFAFYSFAGFLFSNGNPMRFALTSGAAVYLCFTCVGGYLISSIMGGSPATLTFEAMLRYLCFGASAVFLLANLLICTQRVSYQPHHLQSGKRSDPLL